MKIGLTYDLRSEYLEMGYSPDQTAEFDRDDTIDAIEKALSDLGYQTDRIGNAKNLVKRLAKGDRWDLVFNLAEGLQGIGREAQVPTILDLYEIPYTFSDPLVMSLTLHKAMTKRIIRDAGLATTDFHLLETLENSGSIPFATPWFIKPVSEGTGKGTSVRSIINHPDELSKAAENLFTQYQQPVLVEPYLSGREFTVGIIGTGGHSVILGTIEILLLDNAETGVYSYSNKENCESLVQYCLVKPENDPVVKKTEDLCLAAWRLLGCRDAGRMDARCDHRGEPMFMEVNPLAGLHPEHSDLPIICNHLNVPYIRLIDHIIRSAVKRCNPSQAFEK